MSDIVITLNAEKAVTNADALTTALDRIENKAKDVKRVVKKFLLAGQVTLKAKRLATDMKTIQGQINARKLFARVLLRVDKRSLKGLQSQIRTHTGRGADLLKEMGMKKTPGGGWFASQKPDYQKANIQLKRLATKWGVIDAYEKSTMKTIGGIGALLSNQTIAQTKILATQKARYNVLKQHKMLMAKPTPPKKPDPLGLDKHFPPGVTDPKGDQRFAKRIRDRIIDPKEIKQSTKALNQYEKVIRQIDKKTPRTVEGTRKSYQDLKDDINAMTMSYAKGNVPLNEYNKFMKKSKGEIKTLNKEHKKLNKTVRRGRGFFMNFTMALTAVAASMFIWQKVKQVMIKVISYGNELSKTFTNIQAETGLLDASSSGLVKTFEQLSDDTIWGIPEMYDAYKTLRKEGLGTKAAIDQIIPTLKIARNADMDLAKAAKMAAHDTMGLREQYLRLDEAVSKTAGESWGKLKKSIASVFEATYMKMEPKIIETLERLSSFIKENKESLIAGLERIASVVLKISEAFVGATTNMAAWLGKTAEVTEGSALKKQYDVLAGSLDRLTTLKKKAEDAPFIAFSFFPEKAEQLRKKRIAGLDKDIQNVVKKMIVAAKKIKEIGKTEIEETGMTYNADDRLKGYKELFDKTGEMSAKFFQIRGKEIVAFHNRHQAMWKEIGDTGTQTLATLAASIDAYNLKWQNQSAYMKQNAELFKFTGKMSDDYYNKLTEKIKDSIILYDKLTTKEKENLIFLKTRAEFNKRQAALAKPHEEVFEETGVMTGWLKQEKLRKATSDFMTKQIQMEETGGYIADIRRNYQMKVLKIETDFYAKRLENQATHFDATGKATNEFIELQIGEYQRAASAMMIQGMDPKAVKAQYDEMIKNLTKDLIAPMLGEWQKYYDATKKMSEKHTAINQINLSFQYEHMKNVLGDQEAAYEWLVEKANEAAIKRLEAEETTQSGIKAAWYRLYEEAETLSKEISDIWVQGAHDVETAWKETFFDAINFEWGNFEQHAIDVLTAIRDTLNEIVYAMFKDWAKVKLGDTFGKMIGFDRDKEAQKTLKQTAALEAQNIVLGKQAGMIATLTAEYWALAMAMAACGMGGGGTGQSDMSIAGEWNTVSSWHKGGRVGIDFAPQRTVPMSIFTNAPRLHNGLRRDEFPAILQQGETVYPKNAPQNSITINVPVSVEGNNQLAGKIRTEVESLVYDIMQEEIR